MLIGLDLFWQLGDLRQGSNLYTQLSESEEKHLRLTVKQLICGRLNRMRISQALPQPYLPWTGMRSHGRRSGWELEFGDYGVIPG